MLHQVVLDLVGVDLPVCRAPRSLAASECNVPRQTTKSYGFVGNDAGRGFGRNPGVLENERVQHLLCLPLRRTGFGAERDIATLSNLLSFLVSQVHGVLAVPHLHLPPARVDGALLILHCHGCSPVARRLSLIVENNSFIHHIGDRWEEVWLWSSDKEIDVGEPVADQLS